MTSAGDRVPLYRKCGVYRRPPATPPQFRAGKAHHLVGGKHTEPAGVIPVTMVIDQGAHDLFGIFARILPLGKYDALQFFQDASSILGLTSISFNKARDGRNCSSNPRK